MSRDIECASLTCLVLAGGEGSRIGNPEKHMIEVLPNTKLVDLLLMFLLNVCKHVVFLISHRQLNLARYVLSRYSPVDVILTSGTDLVYDLCFSINFTRVKPALVVCGDLVVLNVSSVTSCILRALEIQDEVAIVSLCYADREYCGISIVNVDSCTPGIELSWKCVCSLGRASVQDIDTVSDVERVREVLARLLYAFLY